MINVLSYQTLDPTQSAVWPYTNEAEQNRIKIIGIEVIPDE